MTKTSRTSAAKLRLHPDLSPLADLARNLYWAWNPECQALFAATDPALWKRTEHNPIKMLKGLSRARQAQLAADARFMAPRRRCR